MARRTVRTTTVATADRNGILGSKAIIGIARILNGYPYNTIGNAGPEIVHIHPVLVIVVTTATNTVTIVGNYLLATHGGTRLRPGHVIVIVTADSALVPLGAASRRKQVIHLALVKIAVPCGNKVVHPRRNIYRNLGIREAGLDCCHDIIKILAAKAIIRNTTTILIITRTCIARGGILEKIWFNQPDGCSLRSKIISDPLSQVCIAG